MIHFKFLYKPGNLKKILALGIAILIITVLAETLIALHPYFAIADFFSFNAAYGFISCVLLVILAKLLGRFIKRREDYYDS